MFSGGFMTIYAYTRVSKAENETGTTDNQIINIESQLKIDNVYSDVNISGSMPFQKRPEAQSWYLYSNQAIL
jgi:DNA invertase Pin-like site-specific DNA recombinase